MESRRAQADPEPVASARRVDPLEEADVETSSERYALRFSGAVGEWFLQVQARETLALLASRPSSVLEVGGGHGQLTGPLVDAGHAVSIYASGDSCRERVEGWVSTGRARFSSGDLLHAPFADQAFDAVLCFRLLPHARRWRELVGELCRLARVAVVVDYPTMRSVNAFATSLFGLKKGVEGDTRSFTVFRDAEIDEAFAARGFRRTARRPQFLLPMALHRGLHLAPLSRALERLARGVALTRWLGSPVIARFERG
jgi:SAM-dependent methyltransferase